MPYAFGLKRGVDVLLILVLAVVLVLILELKKNFSNKPAHKTHVLAHEWQSTQVTPLGALVAYAQVAVYAAVYKASFHKHCRRLFPGPIRLRFKFVRP